MHDSLYRQLLGEAYGRLPAPLQAMHDMREPARAHGIATVERGHGLMPGLIGWVFGFPDSGDNVPLTVSFTKDRGREIWERDFAGKRLRSIQELGRGRQRGQLIERFGPFAFSMTAQVRNQQLYLDVSGAWFAGVPLPSILHPRALAFEHDADGRFNFHVELGLPLVGRLVQYSGWLEPVVLPGGNSESEAL